MTRILNLYFFIMMVQSWSRKKYSISHMSLPTGYGCNHEAVIYHYYHSGGNIYQQQQHFPSSFVFRNHTFSLQHGFHI